MGEREPRKTAAWPEWHKAVKLSLQHRAFGGVIRSTQNRYQYLHPGAWRSMDDPARFRPFRPDEVTLLARTADPRPWDV